MAAKVVTSEPFAELWADPEAVAAACDQFTYHEISTWNDATAYVQGDLVYGNDGFVYRAVPVTVPAGVSPVTEAVTQELFFSQDFSGPPTPLTDLGYTAMSGEGPLITDGHSHAVAEEQSINWSGGAIHDTDIAVADYWVQWTVRADDEAFAMYLCLALPADGQVDDGYALYADPDTIGLLREGSSDLWGLVPMTWTLGVDRVLRVERHGNNFTVLVDGEVVQSAEDTASLVETRTGFKVDSGDEAGVLVSRHRAGSFAMVTYWQRDDQALADQQKLEAAIAQASWVLWSLTNGAFHGPECWTEDYRLQGCKLRLRRGPLAFISEVLRVHECGTAVTDYPEWCLESTNTLSFCCGGSVEGMKWEYPSPFMCGCGDNVRVTYAIRSNLPPGTSAMVGWLACEYGKAAAGKPCSLPERVTSITRQGVSWTVLDPQEFLAGGFMGMGRVDQWLMVARRGISGQFIDPMRGIRKFSYRGNCGGQFGDEDVADAAPDPFDLAFRTQQVRP